MPHRFATAVPINIIMHINVIMQPLIRFTGINFNFTLWVPLVISTASSASAMLYVLHFLPSIYTDQPLS